MADLFLGVLSVIAALGGAALVWIWWRWESVASRVADIQVKVLTVVMKALAAAVAAGGAYATGEKSHWWSPVAAGLACVVVWEVIEKLVDARVKAADRVAKAEFAALKSVCEERTELLDVFRCALEDRYGHMAEVVRDRGENPTIPLCVTRSPQGPNSRTCSAICSTCSRFEPRGSPSAPNFRVGLYVVRGGSLVPVVAEDRNNPTYDVFKSYRDHEPSFRLAARDKVAHAVLCVQRRETVIVGDCGESADGGGFHFFDEHQPGYLRSMVAHFMGEIVDANGSLALAALVADSNLAGVFQEGQRDSLEFTLREFAARIKIEMALVSLLSKIGGS